MICRKGIWTLAVVVLGVGTYGCTSLPDTSRTASVHEVKLQEKISPEMIQVQPGDEVRWTNLRKLPAQLDVPNLTSDDLSCQRGFTNWMGSLRETAYLKPNETASLCFKKPAVMNYNIRAETSLGGGNQVLPGSVNVGNPLVR
jgi:plastocyanin